MSNAKALLFLVVAAGAVALIIFFKPKAEKSAAPPSAQDRAQTDCVAAASDDYNKASLALLQVNGVPVMSVETDIAQRRLQEQYCLRLARCPAGGIDPTTQALIRVSDVFFLS